MSICFKKQTFSLGVLTFPHDCMPCRQHPQNELSQLFWWPRDTRSGLNGRLFVLPIISKCGLLISLFPLSILLVQHDEITIGDLIFFSQHTHTHTHIHTHTRQYEYPSPTKEEGSQAHVITHASAWAPLRWKGYILVNQTCFSLQQNLCGRCSSNEWSGRGPEEVVEGPLITIGLVLHAE